MADNNESSTRTWATVSLVVGVLILAGSLSDPGAWPVAFVQAVSVTGSVLYLFGGEGMRNAAMVALYISGALEAFAAAGLLIFAIIFLSNPAYAFGWALVIGIYALVALVPVAGVAFIDITVARRIEASLSQKDSQKETDTAPLQQLNV